MTSPRPRHSPHAPAPAVYVSLASNIEPEAHLLRALDLLDLAPLRLVAVSPFYITPAIGRPEQPDYYNGVARFQARFPPRLFKFELLRCIEGVLGRTRRGDRYAPRTIDLDLLACGDAVIDAPDFVLPDPDLLDRPFLAAGVLALDPDFVVPGIGLRLAERWPPASLAGLRLAEEFNRTVQARYNRSRIDSPGRKGRDAMKDRP